MFKDIKLSDGEIYLEIYQSSDGDNDNPPTYRFCIKTLRFIRLCEMTVNIAVMAITEP